jgi:hypothetical protein
MKLAAWVPNKTRAPVSGITMMPMVIATRSRAASDHRWPNRAARRSWAGAMRSAIGAAMTKAMRKKRKVW